MRKFLLLGLVGALVCGSALVAASPAKATRALFVAGFGASTTSGDVAIYARAIGPAVGEGIPVAPAVGFLRASDTSLGDLSGSVSCIGLASPRAAIVSGDLVTPVVSNGVTYSNFSLIVVLGGNGVPPWIELLPDNLAGLGPCGTSLFAAAGIPDLPNDVLVEGRFFIFGGL
jgi:hypothetical protein